MPDSALAIFSDIHSNLEALEAVLSDMEYRHTTPHLCLGDVVGYGASPAKCLERVRALSCGVLQGNHDAMAAADISLAGISDTAVAGIEYSREKLSREQRDYLENLPLTLSEGDCAFVHSSLEAPADWWYVADPLDALAHFQEQTAPICFCGHTHVPMVWHLSKGGVLKAGHGEGRVRLPRGGKTLVNVGSVGQPRDLNPDACYVTYDAKEQCVEFHRIPYDIEKTQRKIRRAKLPEFTGERLTQGR